jgi:hypothetical protein
VDDRSIVTFVAIVRFQEKVSFFWGLGPKKRVPGKKLQKIQLFIAQPA